MPDDEPNTPRFWYVKYHCRKQWHQIRRILAGFARNKFFAWVAPPIITAYYLILDIWGDRWPWITDNQERHEQAFIICLIISMVGLFLRGFLDSKKQQVDESANNVISNFVETVGAIVEAKIERFRKKVPGIRPNANKFTHITHPEEQLSVIANATCRFICSAFNFKEQDVDITIMRRKAKSTSWVYTYQYQKWRHTDANDLFAENSAAKESMDTKEHCFFPDKFRAASENKYFLSRRDKKRGSGSAFIYPISIKTSDGEEQYVVSIVTYGNQLCDDWDEQSKEVSQSFLREFCRRIELELCLKTIKHL